MKTLVHDTVSGAPRRVTWEDPGAAHQIRLSLTGAKIAVSCTCLGAANAPHDPLATRNVFADGEAMAIWRAHMDEVATEHTA